MKNDLKKDAAMRFGNIAQSYRSPFHAVKMSVSEALRPKRDNSFAFVCLQEPTKEWDEHCLDDSDYASTHDANDYMILCPTFFLASTHHGGHASDAIDQANADDKDDYMDSKEDGVCFPMPQSPGKYPII